MGRFVVVLALAPLMLFLGCGSDGHLKCFPVQGKILVNGQPVKGLRIWLVPNDETLAKAQPPVRPYGECDDQGHIQFTSYTQGDGAPVGPYTLFVEPAPGMLGNNSGEDAVEPEPTPKGKRPRLKLSPKYMDPKQSGILVTVEAKENKLSHDLK